MAIKIITAYKSGGIYNEGHIERLAKQVKTYSGLELIPVYGEHRHWWCKLDIFQLEGPCLFMDLDTTIVDDLSPLLKVAEEKRFVGLRDFNYNDRFQSSIMSWNGDMSHIHADFAEDPEGHMNAYPGGDQQFVGEGGYHPEYFQDLAPNLIQSYKMHVRNRKMHKKCCIVCYHGQPKFEADSLVYEAADLAKTGRGFRGTHI